MLHVEKNAEPLRQLRAKEGVFFVTGNVNSRCQFGLLRAECAFSSTLRLAFLCAIIAAKLLLLSSFAFSGLESTVGFSCAHLSLCCCLLAARVSHGRG